MTPAIHSHQEKLTAFWEAVTRAIGVSPGAGLW
jgi:hypothetical protein